MAAYKKRKFPVFLLGYFIFLVVLTGFWAYVLRYVRDSLVTYEASQPERIMENFVRELEEGKVEDLIIFPVAQNRFEDMDIVQNRYMSYLAGQNISYEKAPGSYDVQKPVYNIYAGDRKVASVALREVSSEPLMFILAVQEWEIVSVEPVLDTGEKNLLIHVPDSCTVQINGITADERELTGNKWDMEEFEYAAEYVSVPYLVEYEISNLFEAPEVVIRDSYGQEMEYTEEEGIIEAVAFPSGQIEQALADYVLKNAKNYSDFFSGDLAGGRNSVEPLRYMFPKDSYFLEQADHYRRYDLWMYSQHQAPTFANESVTNYVRYSEDFFSCDVYFEKTMVLTKTGEVRTVVTNDKYYYVNIDGKWVVVDMRTILGDE